jgi:hypothetical protein
MAFKTAHFFALLALLAAPIGACSSSTPGLSAEQACTDLAAARCKQLDACGANLIAVRFSDLATCLSREHSACMASLTATATAATPETTEQCTLALPDEACSDFLNNNTPGACQAPPGPGALGAACVFNGQCASQFCGIGKNAACGTCQDKPAAGDSCSDLSGCGPGLKCVHQGTVCADVNTTSGESCDKDNPCGAGYSCVGAVAATMTAGTCQLAVSSVGAPCDPKKKLGPGCDPNLGLVCDAQASVCVAIQFVEPGATCDSAEHVCSSGASCVIPMGQSIGTCVPAAADGAACDTVAGPDCMNLSRCVVSGGAGTAGICAMLSDASCH